jgi:hypothetical protein
MRPKMFAFLNLGLEAVRCHRTRQKVRAIMGGADVQATLNSLASRSESTPRELLFPTNSRMIGPRSLTLTELADIAAAELTGPIFTSRNRRPVSDLQSGPMLTARQ